RPSRRSSEMSRRSKSDKPSMSIMILNGSQDAQNLNKMVVFWLLRMHIEIRSLKSDGTEPMRGGGWTMTGFVDVHNMGKWIQREGVEPIMLGMVDYLEADFARWEAFDKVPRVASHTPFGVIELMPTSDNAEYSFKYVNGHPSNPARGFQTVTAFGVLADVDNGYPTFLAEMTLLTAVRTAATSAMVAKHLARADSAVMAMIGAGSQAEFQALAFRAMLGINYLQVFDVDPAAVVKLRRNLEP